MFAKFKKFDVHVKAVDGVNQQTVLGAVLTIVTALVVLILLYSEVSQFSRIDVVSRMVTDTTARSQSVKLEVDVEFPAVSCERINFFQEVTRGTLHIHEPGSMRLNPTESKGCRVTGTIVTDKAGGNFRFGMTPEVVTRGNEQQVKPITMSHYVHHIAFLPMEGLAGADKIPAKSQYLDQQQTNVPENSGIYQYSIQVVPTMYKSLYGKVSHANQYAVSEKVLPLEQLSRNEAVSGLYLRDFNGVIVTYDFHPVMLLMEERREKIVDFVSSLFGIVGGVITVLGLVEGFLHTSTKALIGKSD